MANRSEEDICLLCKINKSTAKNSHYTPASLIATAIGKRNYENSYKIGVGEDNALDKFSGRSNLTNTDPHIKQHHHTQDYIFCNECEKRLAIVESEISPILTKDLKNTAQLNAFQLTIKTDVTIADCQKIDSRLFYIYFYSIIWRQSIQQRILKTDTVVLSCSEEERIREILNSSLKSNLKDSKEVSFDVLPLIVLTADNFSDPTGNLICPHSKFVNPYCFLANEFLISIDFSVKPFKNLPLFFNLDKRIFSNELINYSYKENFKIGIIKQYEWDCFLTKTADYEAEKFINHYASELSNKTSLGNSARSMLFRCAKIKNETSSKAFAEDFLDCYFELLEKYKISDL